MTIASTTSRTTYTLNGSTTVYPYGFRILDLEDLEVVTRSAATGAETVLVLNVGYTVSGVGNSAGGSVTLASAGTSGDTLVIRRNRALTQETALANQGRYSLQATESALDAGIGIAQQLQEQIDRTFRLPVTLDPAGYDMEIPSPTAGYAVVGTGTGLTMAALDANAVALPGGGRTVTTLTALLAHDLGTIFNVQDYGASPVASGAANIAAIAAAFVAAQANGGGIIDGSGLSYSLGNLTSDTRIFLINAATDLTLRNISLTATTTGGNYQPPIFLFRDCERIKCEAVRFADAGYDSTVDWKGGRLFYLENLNILSGVMRGFTFRDCHTNGAVSLLTVGGTVGARFAGFAFDNCSVTNTYYGLNFQENGDDVRVRGFRAINARRTYFAYGVSNHDVDLSIYKDVGTSGANSAILIKRYGRNTRLIKLRAAFSGSMHNYGHGVTMEHFVDAGTGPGLIEDIDIDLHIDSTTADLSTFTPVAFRSYVTGTEPAVEETTTTANGWNRISLGGSFASAGGGSPITIGALQPTPGFLTIKPDLATSLTRSQPHYPGFVVRLAHDREVRTLSGNLNAQTVTLPLAQLDSLGFVLKVRTYLHGSVALLAGQNCTYSEDVITGYNANAGNVVIQKATNKLLETQGTANTITFTASGENIVMSFSGAGYAATDGFARIELQYVSRGPQSLT